MLKNDSINSVFSLHANEKNTQKRYHIIVAYDGTDYFGWQVQKDCPSVAQTLQGAFARVFNKKITLFAASRTDAGVHALGQSAVFSTDLELDTATMLRAWSNILTPSIVIRSLQEVAIDYNVHQHVVTKTYWYHFFTSRPLPFTQRYGWNYRHTVDLEKLQQCLEVFLGTHDFRSFSTGDDRGEDTIRTIDNVSVEFVPEYNAYRISISGPKFLKYMVRRIVGACIEVASRTNLEVNLLKTVLDAKNPEHLLPNAPAKGLVLYHIEYKDSLHE
ncbi:MAG: tRNA pseudouridine(38-40) synthase TruA [Candidatus Babeliales bacterium]|nr:tRNA pseudouridine(38-40) synthase TruA [Candidatus Babeliales bacterium]